MTSISNPVGYTETRDTTQPSPRLAALKLEF